MVLGSWLRRRSDLLAPFADDGQFHGLTVDCCELSRVADPMWADYEVDKDRAALTAKRARLLRANFAPSLASALKDE